MWTTQTSAQLDAIHAMLASGHRSVHMERHTLILWGLAAAGLILAATAIFTPTRFPVTWVRAFATTGFTASALAVVAYLDFVLTRRYRVSRAESISFVQMQLTKIWWLMLGLIVVLNLGMHFFGGGYMFYSLVLILMGLALYIHGLFSRQMLALAGMMMITLGLLCIGLRLPFKAIEWLTVCCFGLGWPALGLTLNWPHLNQSRWYRLSFSLAWLLLVSLPAYAIYQWGSHEDVPAVKPISLATFMHQPELTNGKAQVVTLPAGSTVPLHVEITGDVLAGTNTTTLPIRLSKPLEISIKDSRPDGRFRIGDENWKRYTYNYRIRNFSLHSSLDPKHGPQVSLKLYISTNN